MDVVLFKDSPARREVYESITQTKCLTAKQDGAKMSLLLRELQKFGRFIVNLFNI